jgi:hypothetical protein
VPGSREGSARLRHVQAGVWGDRVAYCGLTPVGLCAWEQQEQPPSSSLTQQKQCRLEVCVPAPRAHHVCWGWGGTSLLLAEDLQLILVDLHGLSVFLSLSLVLFLSLSLPRSLCCSLAHMHPLACGEERWKGASCSALQVAVGRTHLQCLLWTFLVQDTRLRICSVPFTSSRLRGQKHKPR